MCVSWVTCSLCVCVCAHGSESCELTLKHPSIHRCALPPSIRGVSERSAEKNCSNTRGRQQKKKKLSVVATPSGEGTEWNKQRYQSRSGSAAGRRACADIPRQVWNTSSGKWLTERWSAVTSVGFSAHGAVMFSGLSVHFVWLCWL